MSKPIEIVKDLTPKQKKIELIKFLLAQEEVTITYLDPDEPDYASYSNVEEDYVTLEESLQHIVYNYFSVFV